MTQQATNHTVFLLEEVAKTVESLGLEQTVKLLTTARDGTLTLSDKRVEFVLKMVSSEFRIPVPDMINSLSKSTKRKFSIMFGVYYLHGQFKISFGSLKTLYKRDKGLLCKYYHEIKNLSSSEPGDAAMIKYRDKFDIMISEFNIKNNTYL